MSVPEKHNKEAQMVKETPLAETPEKEIPAEPTPFDDFVEHEKKALQEFGKAFAALLPEGLREHGDTAVREMVEGYRRLFNATLDDLVKLVERAKLEEKQPQKKTTVPIR
jgi:hypothetical protein